MSGGAKRHATPDTRHSLKRTRLRRRSLPEGSGGGAFARKPGALRCVCCYNVLNRNRAAREGGATTFSNGARNVPKISPLEARLPRSFTHRIGRNAAENICHAFDFAKHIGQPLNHHITINLRGVGDERLVTAVFRDVRSRFRDWRNYAMKKAGHDPGTPAYVYAIEAPDPDHPHAHWAVHVAPHLVDGFREKLPVWVERAKRTARKGGGEIDAFDIATQVVDPHTDKSLAKYLIKGTDRRFVRYLHLERVAAPQGRVWGRRATASPAIGREARLKAGFNPRRDRHKWAASIAAE